jgi:cytochrome c-type biogenesis protein CcmH
MVWIALAVMTGLAMGFVLWPLAFRAREAGPDTREAAFYRAQLDEIARDVERGQLPAAEAASARAEAARRLLAVSESQPQAASSGLGRRRAAAVAIFVIVPAVALGVYQRVGEPDLPDEPLAARKMDLKAPGAIEAAVAKIEAHLMKAPDDRRGWQVLAPVYMQLGRYADAAGAYRRLIALGDDAPAVHAEFGQALVAMSEGVVTAEARAEFDKAPNAPMAKFYRALADEQDGKTAQAKDAYMALAPQATGDLPWMLGLRSHLAALNGGGPAAATVNASPDFSPDQRKMIETMVQGLADRLAKQGGNAEEWGRLIRAYSVLHEADKAKDALASARKALGANADIDALARELRL